LFEQQKRFFNDKLLLFKLLPLTWAVLSGKIQLVFSCQGLDATADSYTIQKGFQIATYKDIILHSFTRKSFRITINKII